MASSEPAVDRFVSAGQSYVEFALDHPALFRIMFRPDLVAMVTHSGWTDGGRLRHPVFKGLRADVDAADVAAVPGRPSAPPTA